MPGYSLSAHSYFLILTAPAALIIPYMPLSTQSYCLYIHSYSHYAHSYCLNNDALLISLCSLLLPYYH